MTHPEIPSDVIVETIAEAIRRGDLAEVPGLLRLLAVQDPTRAGDVLDAINLGIELKTR